MRVLRWAISLLVLFSILSCGRAEIDESTKKRLAVRMDIYQLFPDPGLRQIAVAAGKGDVELLQEFVNQGLNIDSFGTLGVTPLYWAIREGNVSGFHKLLELGADPNVQFEDGGSILRWAVRNQKSDFLKLALEFGADPNQRSSIANETPIFQSLDFISPLGELTALKLLLENGANPNAQNNRGVPLILIAANSMRFDAVYELLNAGANPRLADKTGYSFIDFVRDNKTKDFGSSEISSLYDKCLKYLEQNTVELKDLN